MSSLALARACRLAAALALALLAGCNGGVTTSQTGGTTGGGTSTTGGAPLGPCGAPGPLVGSCNWSIAPASPAPHCIDYHGTAVVMCQEDGQDLFMKDMPCDPTEAKGCCVGPAPESSDIYVEYLYDLTDPDYARCEADGEYHAL